MPSSRGAWARDLPVRAEPLDGRIRGGGHHAKILDIRNQPVEAPYDRNSPAATVTSMSIANLEPCQDESSESTGRHARMIASFRRH